MYDFFDSVPDGVVEELGIGVGCSDCFYDLGRDWFVNVLLFSIAGEVLGW